MALLGRASKGKLNEGAPHRGPDTVQEKPPTIEDRGPSRRASKRKLNEDAPHRGPDTVQEKPPTIEEEWYYISQNGIKKLENLLEGGAEHFTPGDYMSLYTRVYNLCTCTITHHEHDNNARQLYERYKTGGFEDFMHSDVLPALKRNHNELMLRELVKRWDTHKIKVRWMSRFFEYLDRHFIPKSALPSLKDVGLTTFRDLVFKAVKHKVRDVVIAMINREREGELIDRALLKNMVDTFVEMGMGDMSLYETGFEEAVLRDTAAYYGRKSASWIEEDSCADYMLRTEECLRKEKDRAGHYLHSSSEAKLLEQVQHELLAERQTQLYPSFHGLLRDDKTEDVARMYRLFSRIPKGLEQLAARFRQHVADEGTALAKQTEDAANSRKGEKRNNDAGALGHEFGRKVIELHDKYEKYFSECFMSYSLFSKALKEGFEAFFSKNVAGSTIAELLTTFCDVLLKRGGGEKLSDEEIEDAMEKVVNLLMYVSDKDLFFEFQRKKLARRLLFSQRGDDDHERSLLSKLKQQYGGQFTSKMEGMLRDMALAPENQAHFERENEIKLNFDLKMTILTTGVWPTYKSSNLTLPSEMQNAQIVFSNYYSSNMKTRKRKLAWIFSLGSCTVKGKFDAKPIELTLTTFQAALLLLFNEEDRLSYNDIKKRLNLTDEDIVRLLHSLSCAKYKILNKQGPNTKTVGQSDTFEVNTKFTDRMSKIRIPLPPIDEKKVVIEEVTKDRKFAIDACIVRIMKSRKQLPHQQLVAETIEKCSQMFRPDIKMIKARIEDLISRDYLERDKDTPTLFKYVA